MVRFIWRKYDDFLQKILVGLFYYLPEKQRVAFNLNIDKIKILLKSLTVFVLGLSLFWLVKSNSDTILYYSQQGGYEAVIKNYKDEVDFYAKQFRLPSSYLLSLIMLECSGKKPAKPRFEERIYQTLKKLQKGEIKSFEGLKPADLKGMSDKKLKELATSWGPFQIMGYKSLQMKIPVEYLRGKNAVYWGIKWINDDYGDLVRQGKYKDAFHWHNTGKTFPEDGKSRTYDQTYVDRGLAYMKYFSKYY